MCARAALSSPRHPPGWNGTARPGAAVDERKETRTSVVSLPLGPYHPSLSEPYALRLRLHGERVIDATRPDCRYGYRGVRELVIGQPVDDALTLLERVCAHAGQGYRYALCIAIERATHATIPRSAQLARVFFAELEMAQSALWGLCELARALQRPALRARGLEQRERLYALAAEATGERVYWGVARPGGVREGIQFVAAQQMLDTLREVVEVWRIAATPRGVLLRAARRVDDAQPADAPSLAHPAAQTDARRETPYGGYRLLALDWSTLQPGDKRTAEAPTVAAWAMRLEARLKLSYDIMRVCAETLDETALGHAQTPLVGGEGSVTVQTAHGPARLDVTLSDDQRVTRLEITTPCIETLAMTPDWLRGRRLSHVPALLACLDLCPSCAELARVSS
ncbi:MAG TPA: hypothetical protein VF725_05095 [Ktedonobacterales bacterium]